MSEPSATGTFPQNEHKMVTGRGGHHVEASRNFWEGSGLKIDSSSTDVVWCHGAFSNKILTSARNGELIMWDLNKNGTVKCERRTRDHVRSIHVLQYSPILQCYCVTGSADGDIRIWDIRDLTKSAFRIHHSAAVRAVAFSSKPTQSRQVVTALENGSIHRWDLDMGQRGQLDRIPVAHSGPVLSVDWVQPSSTFSSLVSPTRQSAASGWYGGTSTAAFDDILPSLPIAGASANLSDTDSSSPGWLISGGMDRCVKVWDLSAPAIKSSPHSATYTLHTSFPVRRVLWRPGYECEIAVVSNAEFGVGTDFGHGSSSTSTGLPGGLTTAMPSPRLPSAQLATVEAPTVGERSKSVAPIEGSDPVEIWDVRRPYIAKWVVNSSAVEGGVTDIDFADSHGLWALHSSGTFSQLDLRQSRQPLDAIPRSAVSWNTSGSVAFVTDRPKRWEIPYDDINPESKEKASGKTFGDAVYRPTTQNVGAFAPDGAAEDLATVEKLARGYIYTNKDKPDICAHNAEVAIDAGAHDAARTWLILQSLLTDLCFPPTPPLSPLPFVNPQLPLPHSASAPAAIPTISSLSHSFAFPPSPQRSATADATTQKDNSPGRLSKHSDKHRRSSSSHHSSHVITPASSTGSSPRKPSTGLPNVPAQILARRESGAGLPPPFRPHLPSTFRRTSFSTPSVHSAQSETPSDGRSHLSLRHVGEGALDSDSSDSESDEGGTGNGRSVHDKDGSEKDPDSHSPSPASSSRGQSSPYLMRTSTAAPSPLSQLALTSHQAWTEDEKDDDDSPSPASTSAGSSVEEDSDDDRGRGGGAESSRRRSSVVRVSRRSSTKSKTRSRSSTVASFVVSPGPSPLKRVTKQESQGSIRTVTAGGEATPYGMLSKAEYAALKRKETIRELSGGRAGSMRAPSLSLHQRARSEALSNDVVLDRDGAVGVETPYSTARTQSDRTKAAVKEAEDRLRQVGWETMRDRFEQYADEGDIIMCVMLSLVVPKELRIARSRITRFIEAYIEILSRLRLYTCAAYIRKFVSLEEVRAATSLQTTIYTACAKCRKPIVQSASLVHAGRPAGSYTYCTGCQGNVTRCCICHLPVRALMFQCPVCLHGGHKDCYREYYLRRPPDEIVPPAVPPPTRLGRTPDVNPPRGRALSRTNSSYTADGESEDATSTQGDGERTTGSYTSGRGLPFVSSSSAGSGRLCAAGCGHYCWQVNEKSDLT